MTQNSRAHVHTKTYTPSQIHTARLNSGARSCLAWTGPSARTKCVCPHSGQLTAFFIKSCHSEMSISSSLLSPPLWPSVHLTSCRLWKHTSQRELKTQRCLTGRSLYIPPKPLPPEKPEPRVFSKTWKLQMRHLKTAEDILTEVEETPMTDSVEVLPVLGNERKRSAALYCLNYKFMCRCVDRC